MYLQNKYTHVYFSIIERAKTRILTSYFESHHIIPKSLGGTNNKNNLVKLTAREHFICHRLLTKMVISENKSKMSYALWIMLKGNNTQKRDFKISSRTYSKIKEDYAECVRNSKTGQSLSAETKLKISQAKKNAPLKTKGKSLKWYEAHAKTHKGKSNIERKQLNTKSDSLLKKQIYAVPTA